MLTCSNEYIRPKRQLHPLGGDPHAQTCLAKYLAQTRTQFLHGCGDGPCRDVHDVSNALFTSLVNTGGHVQVHPQNYRDARDFGDTLIRNAGQIDETLSGVLPANADLVSVLQTGGLLEGNNGRSRGIALVGIRQPANLRETFVKDYISEGKLPEDNDVESIALGIKLAKSLKVTLGDTVYMYTSNTEGYGAAAYTVVGLLDIAGSQAIAYTSLQAAQELAAPDAVSRIEVHLNSFTTIADNSKLPVVKAGIEKALDGGYSIETWDEVNPGLKGYLDIIGPVSLVFWPSSLSLQD
jgi:ABC-type lipoprotein release transport system permease subunit